MNDQEIQALIDEIDSWGNSQDEITEVIELDDEVTQVSK